MRRVGSTIENALVATLGRSKIVSNAGVHLASAAVRLGRRAAAVRRLDSTLENALGGPLKPKQPDASEPGTPADPRETSGGMGELNTVGAGRNGVIGEQVRTELTLAWVGGGGAAQCVLSPARRPPPNQMVPARSFLLLRAGRTRPSP